MYVALARRHVLFLALLAVATVLRVVAVLGYPGTLWFPDSNSYLGVAIRPQPYPVRPQGYAFFLRALEPLHSFAAVVIVQHVLMLAAAVAMYVLLRRRFRVRRWAATLATVPVLLDAYQIQLEHQLLSDTLFEALLIGAVVAVLWRPRPGWVLCAVAGLALGAAVLTRSVGLPLVAVFAVYLLIRRVGWKAAGAGALACGVPLAGYALWFHATWGVYGFSNSAGIFMFGRTAAFANCATMQPPAHERYLCPEEAPHLRPSSPTFIWKATPGLSNRPNYRSFNPRTNAVAGDFAWRAIRAQPMDYLRVVNRDFGRTFEWTREPYPTAYAVRMYTFPTHVKPRLPHVSVPGGTTLGDARAYAGDAGATPLVQPYARFLRMYQRHVWLPGTLFGMLMAAALSGMVLLWRRLGGTALLPWGTALILVAVPPFTASFDYRYLLPAVPLICLALTISVVESLRMPPRRRPAITPATETAPLSEPQEKGLATRD